ncbi:ciliated left-right organizer metallopeptidase isoform X2 [Stigmatopora argus]
MALRLCLLLLCARFQVSLSRCVFDQVQARARVVRAARPGPERTPGDVAPLRIGFWLSQESDRLPEPEEGRLRAAVERAGRTVSSLLSVARTSEPLLLGRDVDKYCKFLWKDPNTANYNRCGRANKNYMRETCLDVKIPDEHLAGVEVHPQANSTRRLVLRRPGAGAPHVDFLLYVHVGATDKCRAQPGLLAYAAHCRTDGGGRPLAGVVVVCRERLARLTAQTVLHELFHVLGFSKDLFSTWSDCFLEEGLSAGVGCSPRGKVTHADGRGQTRIYTPSIVSALQRHLAAMDPELGGPLENAVSAGRFAGLPSDPPHLDPLGFLSRTPAQGACPPTGSRGFCRDPSCWRRRASQPRRGSTRSPWPRSGTRAGTPSTPTKPRTWCGGTARELCSVPRRPVTTTRHPSSAPEAD